jgi:hypothetical protein
MPRRREDQLALARTWVTALPPLKPLLAVTDAEISELEDLIEDVETRQVAAQTNRGDQVLVAREREAFEAMVAYMRTLRRRRFFNYPMTSSQWLSLGLSPPDLVRTPHIDVTEVVEFELRLRNIREVLINFWIKGEAHHAKPAGYDGAVIIWDVLDSPPAVPDDLSHHTMASRTPHALEFREDQRGKTVYMALAWQNERGLLGQWSEIQSAIIP